VVDLSVTVTNGGGCSASDTIKIDVLPEGMDELLQRFGIRCFPNPVSDRLHLDLGTFPGERMELFGSNGKLIHRLDIRSLRTIEVPLHNLAAATYSLQLISKDGLRLSLKVLKE
jgi:hypothetical protein